MPRVVLSSLLVVTLLCAGCEPPAAEGPASLTASATPGLPPPPPGSEGLAPGIVDMEPSTNSADTSPTRAQEKLLAAYRAAHAKKDLGAMLALYCWDDVSEEMRETVRENVAAELRQPIADIKMQPAEPGQHGPKEEGGIRWRPSLPVTAVMEVRFHPGKPAPGEWSVDRMGYTVGTKYGRCYFTVPVREN